ncbi:hypothetical protein J2Z62_000258 [Mycoplasmoides fastidiosum]|uniref:Lipoprotein n=1 Tax=Mycoplasmoides fastidiosum TaxID=92758 RepID=A0ABU0LYQ7_9BACT|nr:P80 family lipoprotein [Mycoplasmoides fastidiosum]MDQ0513820.1 hypothetical protein [Mycoplasmoides fastidiosum]UUD37763.1 P80 family lipoprotein [Mycoplasmoides fastidiosum]
MFSKLKRKKSIFLFTTSLSMLGSLVLAACGGNNSFQNLQELKFHLPFQKDSLNHKTLLEISDKYKKFLAENPEEKKQAGYMPVDFYVTGKGLTYSEVLNQISGDFTTGNYTNIPQITFGYESLLRELGKFNRELNLSNKNSATEPGLSLDNYYKTFSNFTEIQDIPQSDTQFYAAPISSRSNITILSRPVLHYFFDSLIKDTSAGITIDSKDEEWFRTELGVEKTSTTSLTATTGTQKKKYTVNAEKLNKIKEIWGNPKNVANNFPKGTDGKGYILSKAKMQNYNDFFDLSLKLAKTFNEKSGAVGGPRVTGFNTANSVLQEYAFNDLDTDMNKFLWHRASDNKNYEYPFFNPQNEQYKSLEKAFQKVKEISSGNALWIPSNNDRYSSVSFSNLKMAFSLASAAGYTYYFGKEKRNDGIDEVDLLALPQINKNTETQAKGFTQVDGPKLVPVRTGVEQVDKATKLFIQWMSTTESEYSVPQLQSNGEIKNTSQTLSHIDYYALVNSYLPTTKKFWERTNKEEFIRVNPFLTASFESASDSGNQNVSFQPAVTHYTNAIVQAFNSGFQTSEGFKNWDFKQFISSVRDNPGLAGLKK